MNIDEIKSLMKAGELEKAKVELSGLVKDDPENIELKILLGTCCRLLGDMDTFVKIDDEIASHPNAARSVKWQKYHALRVAACGAALIIATGLSAVTTSEVRELYGIAAKYGIAPEYRVLYGIAPLYGVSPGYEWGEGFGVYASAREFPAALYSDSRPVGVVKIKTGKIKKNGEVRLSGYAQTIDGKKVNFRATTANGMSGKISATLTAANGTSASIVISMGNLSGSWNGYRMETASIGGAIHKYAKFDFGDMPEEVNGYPVLYPNESEPVRMDGTRWNCAKAASMRWVKCPPCRDGVCTNCGPGSWKVNDSNGKTNVSGLRLSYNAKQGTFKGSFKMFTWSPGGKKHTVSVSGIVVDGVGYGTASMRKPNASWTITVR